MALEERYLVAMEDARRRVPEVIRALMAARRAKGPDVARAIGLSSSSFYARLNGKSMIQAHELSALALYFGVPVSFFYEPPLGLLGEPELTSQERAVNSVDALLVGALAA